MTAFTDMFSGHPESYAAHRPTYPDSLFDWIAEIAPATDVVWDCATGSGQAACALASRFSRVLATDGSAAQLEHAIAHERVTYSRATAYDSGLVDGSVDAITVATAAHWFDLDRFYEEVRRVARPGAVVVMWSYFWGKLDDDVRDVIGGWASSHLTEYWRKEVRKGWESGYAALEMPFERLEPPRPFTIDDDWLVERYVGFIRSWSATQAYVEDRGEDPTLVLLDQLRPVWGPGTRPVHWALELLAGRV